MITSTKALIVARKTNGRCFYCNRPAEEIDHFTSKYWWNEWKLSESPVNYGSVDKIENLFPACISCNRRKNSHHPCEFIGSDFKAWSKYKRANKRVGICEETYPKLYPKEPFNHYEWLTFLQKYAT